MEPTPAIAGTTAPSPLNPTITNPRKEKTNIGIAVLGISVVILVIAFSIGLIIMSNNFTKRIDNNHETIEKLEQIVHRQQCQLGISAEFYEGVGLAFGAPAVQPDGTTTSTRQQGVDKIVNAGNRAAHIDACKPTSK